MEEALLSLLRDLGMSEYEAKAMYALFKLRDADAKTIAETSGVPRTKVYEILEEFVKKGYATELDTRPRRFVVSDPQKILRMMVRAQKDKIERLEKRVEKIGEIIPLMTEHEEIEGNYLLRFKKPEDLMGILEDEIDKDAVIGATPKSAPILAHLSGGKHVKTPFDIILTRKAVYLPLSPLGEPSREVVVVVFQDPHIVEVFRRWLNERRGV